MIEGEPGSFLTKTLTHMRLALCCVSIRTVHRAPPRRNSHEARHRRHQALQAGGREVRPRRGRRPGHDRLRGPGLRPPGRPQRDLPRHRVPRDLHPQDPHRGAGRRRRRQRCRRGHHQCRSYRQDRRRQGLGDLGRERRPHPHRRARRRRRLSLSLSTPTERPHK